MEVHVEVAGMREQLGQRGFMGREVRVGDKDPSLPNIDMAVGEVEIDTDRARQPPNNGARRSPRGQVMNVPEADALVSLVVEDDHRLDGPVLLDLDLCQPLRLRRTRRHLDVGPHLRIEDDGRNFITGDTAGEDRYVLTGNMIGIRNRPAATGDGEDGDDSTPVTHTASLVEMVRLVQAALILALRSSPTHPMSDGVSEWFRIVRIEYYSASG